MIKVSSLSKSYGNFQVLKSINITVEKGEVYGFIGHNGAGKTTTISILTGLAKFDSGECLINGHNIKSEKIRFKDVGFLPEEPKFYSYMTAKEYLNFIGNLAGDNKNEIKRRTEEVFAKVKLSNISKKPIGSFSRGMKQKLGLAVAMYHDPLIYLLDEPSSALDPEGRRAVIEIIEELKSRDKTVFLSTHILNDIERICDRIGIINQGKIILEDNIDDIFKKYLVCAYEIEFSEEIMKDDKEILQKIDLFEKVEFMDKKALIKLKSPKIECNNLLKELTSVKGGIVSINPQKLSLEEIFLLNLHEDKVNLTKSSKEKVS